MCAKNIFDAISLRSYLAFVWLGVGSSLEGAGDGAEQGKYICIFFLCNCVNRKMAPGYCLVGLARVYFVRLFALAPTRTNVCRRLGEGGGVYYILLHPYLPNNCKISWLIQPALEGCSLAKLKLN